MTREQKELIYQGKTLSQWQTLLETGCSEEVEQAAHALREVANQIWNAFASLAHALRHPDDQIINAAVERTPHKADLESAFVTVEALLNSGFQSRKWSVTAFWIPDPESDVDDQEGGQSFGVTGGGDLFLTQLLQHPRARVREAASRAIANVRALSHEAVKRVVALLESSRHEVRFAAVEALDNLDTPSAMAVSGLAKILQTEEVDIDIDICDPFDIYSAAVRVLARIGAPAEEALVAFLKRGEMDGFEEERWAAIEALGKIGRVSDTTLEFMLGLSELGQYWAEALILL